MLHHVGIEVRPADVERSVELWTLLGFEPVEPPAGLAEFTWLERDGTQVHLMPTDSPTVPPRGHVAVVAPDFDATCERVAAAGFEVEHRNEYWDAARAKVSAPGGHAVELMASPTSAGRVVT